MNIGIDQVIDRFTIFLI